MCHTNARSHLARQPSLAIDAAHYLYHIPSFVLRHRPTLLLPAASSLSLHHHALHIVEPSDAHTLCCHPPPEIQTGSVHQAIAIGPCHSHSVMSHVTRYSITSHNSVVN